MNLYRKLLLAQGADRAGARGPGNFLGGGDLLSRLALADDLEGQLSQRAGGAADEGSHRAHGQRRAVFGRRATREGSRTGGEIPARSSKPSSKFRKAISPRRGKRSLPRGCATRGRTIRPSSIVFRQAPSADEAKQLYFSELEAAFYKVKASADEILAINQDTMVRKSDDVRRTGERMNAITIAVALAALALGLLVSTLLDASHAAAARRR